jgi:hypothetical protein
LVRKDRHGDVVDELVPRRVLRGELHQPSEFLEPVYLHQGGLEVGLPIAQRARETGDVIDFDDAMAFLRSRIRFAVPDQALVLRSIEGGART